MASRNKTRSSTALDPLMAGFAAGAAAFIIYAMPQARFDDAISLTGLPVIVSAAAPPLGSTARVAVMAAAAVGGFLLVWLVLRALSKPAPRPRRRSGPVEIDVAPPRLRRADAHPDAPSRRPILAGTDLGRPFDDLPVDENEPWDELTASEDQPLEEQPWSDAVAAEERPEPTFAADEFEPAYDLPAFEEEPAQADEWPAVQPMAFDEPSQNENIEDEDEPAFAAQPHVPDFMAADEEAEDEAEEEAEEEAHQEDEPLDLSPHEVKTVHGLSPHLPDADEDRPADLPQLMERFEEGLRRRQPTGDVGSSTAGVTPEMDARLRGALNELQKLAGRGI